MKKQFIAILLSTCILLLSGCGDKNATSSKPSEVDVKPSLYSAYDAFDTVITAAGYYDSTNGRQLVEQYLAKYGYTLSQLKLDLQQNPSTNVKIAEILNSVQLKISEIDWSTVRAVYDLPVFTDTGSTTEVDTAGLYLTNDHEEFITMMKKYGYKQYKKLLSGIGPISDLVSSVPDLDLIEDTLTQYSPMDILTMYSAKAKMIDANTVEFKPVPNKSYFYEFARRNGFKYVTFYPSVAGDDNSPVYMRNPYGTSEDIPTWQAYFILYADYLYTKMDLDVSNAIYNVTNDGIECWWSPSTGRTVELDVYASGLIRLIFGNDDRYEEYQNSTEEPSTDTQNKTIRAFIYDKLNSEFDINNSDFNTLVTMCKVFYLPCANIDLNKPSTELTTFQMQGWLDAASIYSNYLSKSKMQKLTPYVYSKYLVDFANIGRNDQNITDLLSMCEQDAENPNPISNAATVNPAIIDIYKQFTDKLLEAVGSKSTFLIEGYNAIITNIEFVGDNSSELNSLKTEIEQIQNTQPLIYTLGKEVYGKALANNDMLLLYAGDLSIIEDTTTTLNILKQMQSAALTEETTLGDATQILLNWIAYGRSPVTKQNIQTIDKAPIAEWTVMPLKELSRNTAARKALASLLDEAIAFADTGSSSVGSGNSIAEILIPK